MSLLLSCLLLFITLTGCGTLPSARDLIYGPADSRSPTVIGPHGELSPERSKRIIERLGKDSGATDLLTRQSVVLEEISGSPLIAGNETKLLVDGPATYAAMIKAIQDAVDHINIETFSFEDDEIGRYFANLLLEKQRQGVQVNLIYDSIGSKNTPPAFFKPLRDSGIKVLEFNPVNLLKAKKIDFLTHRDHRKILIIDGKIAFTGGVNISEVYSSSPSGQNPPGLSWRDTHVQITGPAVASFQKLFLDTWKQQKGPEIDQKNYFPEPTRQGKGLIQVIGSTPGEKNRITYVMYFSAITFAEKSIHLTTAYFVPDEEMLNTLTSAAKRGLDVKLIVPGTSDSGLVLHAGRSRYEDLLEAGVKLYERQGGMLHAKTAVIDGVWSTVGSTNLDLWSFARNDEVNAVILGQEFGAEMEALFTADLAASQAITPEGWSRRPLSSRLQEWFARLFAYWL